MTRPTRRPCVTCEGSDQIHVGLKCLNCGVLTILAPLPFANPHKKGQDKSAAIRRAKAGLPAKGTVIDDTNAQRQAKYRAKRKELRLEHDAARAMRMGPI